MVDLTRMIQGGMDLAKAFGRGDDAYNTEMSKKVQMENMLFDAGQKRNAAIARRDGAALLRDRGTPEGNMLALALEGQIDPKYFGVGSKDNEAFTLSPGSKRFGADGKVIAEVPFAPANAQLVEIPDGTGGAVKMVFDPRTRGFQMPQYGGGSGYEDGSTVGPSSGVGPNGVPFNFDPSLTADQRRAAMEDVASGGASDNYNLPPSATMRFGHTPPKQKDAPSGYRWGAGGDLEMIPGGPAQIAADARNAALQAKNDAAAAKDAAQREAAGARQAESITSANELIAAIDRLTGSKGFPQLGSAWGDIKLMTPLLRNDVKDADAQLRNIGGQVALATMSRLKALSSQGATGFGALSEKELTLLENSIATLKSENVSNEQIKESLRIIREKMQKISDWKPMNAAPTNSGGWSIQRVE